MINAAIDNALITYTKKATGINKVLWAYPNAPEEQGDFVVLTLLNLTNVNGVKSESGYFAKTATIRFDVFTENDDHILRTNDLVDELDNEDAQLELHKSGVIGIKELNDVTDTTFIDKAYHKFRAFVDVRFGVTLQKTWNYGTIERISGTLLDLPFDVAIEQPPEQEENE